MQQESADNPRQVKGSIAKTILSYVRRALGEAAVERVLERAGLGDDADGLSEPASWTSHEATVAIAEAAEAVCGEVDIGRRAGEELMRLSHERGTVDFVRATGSVPAALELVINVSTKMSQGRTYEIVEIGDGHATIVGTYLDPAHAHSFYCGYGTAYFGLVPQIFGHSAVVTEPECMSRGDERCVNQLVWTPGPGQRPTVADREVAESRERASSIIARFEELHHMATELVGAEEVDTLLDRITDRAGVAVHAPRNLLAVHTRDGLHLHHRGFEDDAAADRLAHKLLAGELQADERTLVAEVASGSHAYGRLVALYPRGSSVTEVERRLLDAYARHAAAALESVDSLEQARRDRDTAQGLLTLADALAQVGAKDDVARRLGTAIPSVVDCTHANVWLWDPDNVRLELAAQHPPDEPHVLPAALDTAQVPELADLVSDPAPVIADLADAPQHVRAMLPPGAPSRWALVPIRARGRFLGLVGVTSADLAAGDDGHSELLARLRGLTDQAATALDNAELLERVREQALVDALTGLPNRKLLEDRVRTALQQASRGDGGLSLLFIDLDRFKKVNDTLGHEAGDEVLRQSAERIRGCIRTSDTLARLGGDEFVVLLPDAEDEARAQPVIDKILAAFARPFAVADRDVMLTCSIGLACSADEDDYSSLMRTADAAMYRAKESGGAQLQVAVEPALPIGSGRLDLERDLHAAIERDELHVLYQPQVDIDTLEVHGVEALVRWDHPTMGRVRPDVFLPVAEGSGLIVALDRWVRTRALEQARAWWDAGARLRMAINLSDRSLRDPGLPEHVAALLERLALPPDTVELEVTERVLLSDRDLHTVLAPLHELGARLAIDDLGTGTSVLARLTQLPLDTVKLDRSLVATISDDHDRAPVIDGVLTMAAGLGIDVVAEGVELDGQRDFLRRSGRCRLAQGFLFSPPVEAHEIRASRSPGADGDNGHRPYPRATARSRAQARAT